MLPQIAIFLAGAATTGYTWYRSSTKERDEEPTLGDDLATLVKYVLLIITVYVAFKWLLNKAAASNTS